MEKLITLGSCDLLRLCVCSVRHSSRSDSMSKCHPDADWVLDGEGEPVDPLEGTQ